MNISEKLQKLIDIKSNIKHALIDKGVDVGTSKFEEYPNLIANIKSNNSIELPPVNEDGSWSDELKEAWNAKAQAAWKESMQSKGGTVDTEGLRYLNWSEDDIQYLQDHCPWTEIQNADFIVSEYDKWFWDTIKTTYLGGDKDAAITQTDWNTIMQNAEYASNVKFFPKINTSALTKIYSTTTSSSTNGSFCNWYSLYALPLLNTTNVTNMSSMFYACHTLSSVPLFDTYNVTNMSSMFNSCYSLTSVPLFNTANVTNMSSMFNGCCSFTSVPLFNTANVTNMSSMFSGCYLLTSVPLFDTTNVTKMTVMFQSCRTLLSVPLFDTYKVIDMYGMFNGCLSLSSVPLFNTANVTSMSYMFCACYLLTSVPLFDTANVTSMSYMFQDCSSLKNIEIGIKFANIVNSSYSKALSGKSLIDMIKNANNTAAISQTYYMTAPAAKYIYEYSLAPSESWMDTNDGTQSAQTWLAVQAAKTNKPKSTFAITLSFASGSSDYTA